MARELYELRINCNNSSKRVNDLKDCLNINSLLCEIEKLEKECNEEGFWNDNKRAKQVLKKLNKDKQNVEQIKKLESWYEGIKELLDSNDADMILMADEELENADLLLEKNGT